MLRHQSERERSAEINTGQASNKSKQVLNPKDDPTGLIKNY